MACSDAPGGGTVRDGVGMTGWRGTHCGGIRSLLICLVGATFLAGIYLRRNFLFRKVVRLDPSTLITY